MLTFIDENTLYLEVTFINRCKIWNPTLTNAIWGCFFASKVHRLHDRSNKSPFSIIKVTLSRTESSAVLKDQIIIFGHKYQCQSCRSTKIIRCFQCQRYGHTAKFCLFAHRCVNCGGDHQSPCTFPQKCANCDGEHGAADSYKCPGVVHSWKSWIICLTEVIFPEYQCDFRLD